MPEEVCGNRPVSILLSSYQFFICICYFSFTNHLNLGSRSPLLFLLIQKYDSSNDVPKYSQVGCSRLNYFTWFKQTFRIWKDRWVFQCICGIETPMQEILFSSQSLIFDKFLSEIDFEAGLSWWVTQVFFIAFRVSNSIFILHLSFTKEAVSCPKFWPSSMFQHNQYYSSRYDDK